MRIAAIGVLVATAATADHGHEKPSGTSGWIRPGFGALVPAADSRTIELLLHNAGAESSHVTVVRGSDDADVVVEASLFPGETRRLVTPELADSQAGRLLHVHADHPEVLAGWRLASTPTARFRPLLELPGATAARLQVSSRTCGTGGLSDVAIRVASNDSRAIDYSFFFDGSGARQRRQVAAGRFDSIDVPCGEGPLDVIVESTHPFLAWVDRDADGRTAANRGSAWTLHSEDHLRLVDVPSSATTQPGARLEFVNLGSNAARVYIVAFGDIGEHLGAEAIEVAIGSSFFLDDPVHRVTHESRRSAHLLIWTTTDGAHVEIHSEPGDLIGSLASQLVRDPHEPNAELASSPMALDDEIVASPGRRIALNPVENDLGGQPGSLRIIGVGRPANGRVNLDADGRRLLYESPRGFDGIDVFDYFVVDPHGVRSAARVSVRVEPGGPTSGREGRSQDGAGVSPTACNAATTCNGHGTCVLDACACFTGFTGPNCNSCATNYYNYPSCTYCLASTTCNGHGSCTGTGSCACATGFTGASCSTCATNYYNYPTCTYCLASTTCSGHGSCSSSGSCTCTAAYSGTNCASCATNYYNYPTCTYCLAASTCSGHGSCTGTGSCSCSTGFTGTNCNQCAPGYYGASCSPCPGGAATPCNNHGTCSDGISGTGTCACSPGYAGSACQYSDAVTCNGHGTANPDGSCSCYTGFTGSNCASCSANYYNYPTCTYCLASTTCNGHGTCNASGGCACSSGFSGPNCSTCAANYYNYPTCTYCLAASTCNGHGTCTGTGSCLCSTGYTGPNCSSCASGYWSSGGSCIPNPSITSVGWVSAPTSGGQTVTITGTNFGAGGGAVTIGGVGVSVGAWSNTSITVTSVAGVGGGLAVQVTPTGGPTVGGATYSYDPPAIFSASPVQGTAGTLIAISGSNFGATSATGVATVGASSATPSAWGHTSITIAAPIATGLELTLQVTAGSQPSNSWVGFSYTDTDVILLLNRTGSDTDYSWSPNGSAALYWTIEEAPSPTGPWTPRVGTVRPTWTGTGDAAAGPDRYYRVVLD